MDIRPPAYRQHRPPLDSFRVWSGNQSLRLLSADFTELYNLLEKTVARLPLFGVSGWTLRGVTPSFHPSEYQFSKIFGQMVPFDLVRKLSVCNQALTRERVARLSLP